MSLPINLFKGAYLGVATGVLTSAATKDGNMVRGARYGFIGGVAYIALASLLETFSTVATEKGNIETIDSKEAVKNFTEQLYDTYLGSLVWVALVPSKGKVSIGDAAKGFAAGVAIATMGDFVVSIVSKKRPAVDVQQIAYPELTSKHLKGLGLGGMDKHLEPLQRLLNSRAPSLKQEVNARHLKPIKGLLLYGPPGTGKTTLARHLGEMLGCSRDRLIFKAAPELKNMFIGNSEENVRKLFEPAKVDQKKLGKDSPLHVVVIDEIDALIGNRENSGLSGVVNTCEQFLTCLDGLESIDNLVVIGITNRYEILDKAAIRSGRFDVQLEIGAPDAAGRKEIFEYYLERIREFLDESINVDELVNMTAAFFGAEIEGLVNDANSKALARGVRNKGDESLKKITMADLRNALQTIKDRKSGDQPPPHMYL